MGLTEIQSGALAIIDRLQRLKITNNNILVLTADAFVNCSALEYLNLSNNNIQVCSRITGFRKARDEMIKYLNEVTGNNAHSKKKNYMQYWESEKIYDKNNQDN